MPPPTTGPGDDDTDSPARLRASAAELRARARVFQARAKALTDEADAREQAADLIEAARKTARDEGRQMKAGARSVDTSEMDDSEDRLHSATVDSTMRRDHRLAIAQGMAERRGAAVSPLATAAHAKGYTLRSLAQALGRRLRKKVPVASLSAAGLGNRPIQRSVAEAVAELTGVPATGRSWPGGIQDDE